MTKLNFITKYIYLVHTVPVGPTGTLIQHVVKINNTVKPRYLGILSVGKYPEGYLNFLLKNERIGGKIFISAKIGKQVA